MNPTSQAIIDASRLATNRRWLEAWNAKVAYCLTCSGDYPDDQAIFIDGTEHCPLCKSDYGKRYYYCDAHGSPDDDCER
jgi:hypothetical protein